MGLVDALVQELRSSIVSLLQKYLRESDRVLLLFAWLSTRFREELGCELMIVRGFAVELWTGGVELTVDVDIATIDPKCSKALEEFAKRIGSKIGRVYSLDTIAHLITRALDIVPITTQIRFVEVCIEGFCIKVQSPEDTLVKCLADWKFWNSDIGKRRAEVLWLIRGSEMDIHYLCTRAREDYVLDKLMEIGGEDVCKDS